MIIKTKKLHEKATLPLFATTGSAGADICACIDEDIVLKPGERRTIPAGISIEIPTGYGGFVFPRSSLATKYGISLSNCVGVIDSDYRGEIQTPLIHHGDEDFVIRHGDRIAQIVILAVETPEYVFVDELNETERGEGGFGSTGR